jgi:hypothetical protein
MDSFWVRQAAGWGAMLLFLVMVHNAFFLGNVLVACWWDVVLYCAAGGGCVLLVSIFKWADKGKEQ